MSIMSKSEIVERLKTTGPESPLAVFLNYPGGSYLERQVMFANTLKVQQKIKSCQGDLVGVFDRTSVEQFKKVCP